MQPLFELAAEYRAISDKLHDLDLPEDVIADTLESVGGDLQEKSVNVAKYFRNLEAMAEQIKQAEQQMTARRKALENRAEWLKSYLHRNMNKTGITKIECPWFVISVKKNPVAIHIDDEASIPDEYMREIPAKYEPDKKKMKSAMQEGTVIPGAHLEQGTHLEIK